MNLEQQVCSLDLAKRLKELGVKQEGYFVWEGADEFGYVVKRRADSGSNVSAFTVAELGEMLPKHLLLADDGGANRYISITHGKAPFNDNRTWYVYYDQINEPCDYKIGQEAITEADARAKMLIYLLENKLITV